MSRSAYLSNPTNLTLSHTKIALERSKRIQDKILSRTYLFNLCARNLLCLPASFQCKIKKWKMILFRKLIYTNAMQSVFIFLQDNIEVQTKTDYIRNIKMG